MYIPKLLQDDQHVIWKSVKIQKYSHVTQKASHDYPKKIRKTIAIKMNAVPSRDLSPEALSWEIGF